MLLADKRQLSVIIQHGIGVLVLRFNAEGFVFVVHSEPRLGSRGCEAAIRRVAPGHWCASIISSFQLDGFHYVGHVWFFRGIFILA